MKADSELKPGWLARGMDSARKETERWPRRRRALIAASEEFRIEPTTDETGPDSTSAPAAATHPPSVWALASFAREMGVMRG